MESLLRLQENDLFLSLKLQLFAGDESDEGDEMDNEDSDNEEVIKKFSQEDLNRVAAKESKKAQRKLLKELGFESADEIKAIMAKVKEQEEKNQDDATKAKNKVKEEETKRIEAETKVKLLENKFTALAAGVNADMVDDFLAVAMSKVDEDNDLTSIIDGLKTKYPTFFSNVSDDSKGTGGKPSNNKGGKYTPEGIGQRLGAEKAKKTKSNYF